MSESSVTWYGRTAPLSRPPIVGVTQLAASLADQGVDLIDLGQAIVGMQPPAVAIQAAHAALDGPSAHVYSPDPGLPELREALAEHLRTRKHVACPSGAHVMVTCGANQAFANALFALTRPGDDVITFGPGYFDHDYTIAMAGCRKVEVPLVVDGRSFRFDLDAVRRAFTPQTRCVVLVSPGNPTGAVASEAFVRELTDHCRSRDVWVISDETYDLLTYQGVRHVSPAEIAGFDRVAVVGTFSKLLAVAGWRVGYLAGAATLIDEAFKVQDALVICAPVPLQRAVFEALPSLDDYVAQVRQELDRRRQALIDALDGFAGAQLRVPDGATFGLAKVTSGADDVAFCEEMVRRTGVVAVPGSAFGPLGAGHIRLSFGNQTAARIAEAGRRIRAWSQATT